MLEDDAYLVFSNAEDMCAPFCHERLFFLLLSFLGIVGSLSSNLFHLSRNYPIELKLIGFEVSDIEATLFRVFGLQLQILLLNLLAVVCKGNNASAEGLTLFSEVVAQLIRVGVATIQEAGSFCHADILQLLDIGKIHDRVFERGREAIEINLLIGLVLGGHPQTNGQQDEGKKNISFLIHFSIIVLSMISATYSWCYDGVGGWPFP